MKYHRQFYEHMHCNAAIHYRHHRMTQNVAGTVDHASVCVPTYDTSGRAVMREICNCYTCVAWAVGIFVVYLLYCLFRISDYIASNGKMVGE
jgi:hypothetical protein